MGSEMCIRDRHAGKRFRFRVVATLYIAETEESLNEMNLTQTFDVCKVDSEDVPNFSLLGEFEIRRSYLTRKHATFWSTTERG